MSSVVSAVSAQLRRRVRAVRHQYLASRPNPAAPELVSEFRFFAVIKTWMDEDIIGATVRNALAQGVEAVFLVDNASSDATVAAGIEAGAVLAESYRTEVFEDRVAQVFLNTVVARESFKCGARHVWWLFLDTDEFPEGPGGMTLVDYLATLDRQFRVVGSTYYNHYPTERPGYMPGFQPIDFQPMCERFIPEYPHCDQGHWKHPLQRFDREGPFLESVPGFHSARDGSPERLYEPAGGALTHHFQYREESVTRAKIALASTRSSDGSRASQAFASRLRSLDAIYSQRWAGVTSRSAPRGASPQRWINLDTTRRWYEPGDVEAAKEGWRREHDTAGSS